MRVIGIDPGLRITGYGIVDVHDGQIEPRLLEAGIIKLNARHAIDARLNQLHRELTDLLVAHRPQAMAVEKLFAHYKHPRTAILMAHARGAILLCAKQQGLTTADLPATEVKRSVTGYGHASKQQMQQAVAAQCGLAQPPNPPDVADAIAIALCHARRLAVARL